MKKCTRCGEEKTLDEFLFRKERGKHKNTCRQCDNKKSYERKGIPRYPFVCKGCGKDCLGKDKRRLSYCSDLCAAKSMRKPLEKCIRCEKEFKQTTNRNIEFCIECYADILKEEKHKRDELKRLEWEKHHIKKCVTCNETFEAFTSDSLYCSDECRPYKQKVEEFPKECSTCGDIFLTNHNINKFCSNKCRRKAENRKKEIRKDIRMKKAKANGHFDSDITLEKLIKRDGMDCYICHKDCAWDDHTITSDGHFLIGKTYPTIEHVIAISNGGTHSWDNVKVACYECNTKKGTKLLDEVI